MSVAHNVVDLSEEEFIQERTLSDIRCDLREALKAFEPQPVLPQITPECVTYSEHAIERMKSRNITESDVLELLNMRRGVSRTQGSGKHGEVQILIGQINDGRPLKVVHSPDYRIVTVAIKGVYN